ncbi:MAG: deoxyribose-phosphate aldolase [Candidatus Hadarchaeota archaeon]
MTSLMEHMLEIENRTKEINLTPDELAKIIDHTELAPNKPAGSMKRLCDEARTHHFYAVCVNPFWTRFCKSELEGTDVKVDTVIGFPLGQTTTDEKVFETKRAIEEGADEIDMVMNIAAFKDKGYDFVGDEIEAIVEAAGGNTVKVILETGYLTYEEIPKACKIVKETGAKFVKNSTGFGPLGATIPHIVLMRESVGKNFGVKASGGIGNFKDALRMIAAGANRIGSSSGVKIIEGYRWAKSAGWPIEKIPCNLCPTSEATFENMPEDVSRYYKEQCAECQYNEFKKFY